MLIVLVGGLGKEDGCLIAMFVVAKVVVPLHVERPDEIENESVN